MLDEVIVRHPVRVGLQLVASGVALAVIAEILWVTTGGYEFGGAGTSTSAQWAEVHRTDRLAAGLGVAAVVLFGLGLLVVATTLVRRLHRSPTNTRK